MCQTELELVEGAWPSLFRSSAVGARSFPVLGKGRVSAPLLTFSYLDICSYLPKLLTNKFCARIDANNGSRWQQLPVMKCSSRLR
jgi:hypothetical protein